MTQSAMTVIVVVLMLVVSPVVVVVEQTFVQSTLWADTTLVALW